MLSWAGYKLGRVKVRFSQTGIYWVCLSEDNNTVRHITPNFAVKTSTCHKICPYCVVLQVILKIITTNMPIIYIFTKNNRHVIMCCILWRKNIQLNEQSKGLNSLNESEVCSTCLPSAGHQTTL